MPGAFSRHCSNRALRQQPPQLGGLPKQLTVLKLSAYGSWRTAEQVDEYLVVPYGSEIWMTGVKVIGFCGNAQRPSKTRALVEAVSEKIRQRHGFSVEIFDLVDAGEGLAACSPAGLNDQARSIVEAIENADALIVGSPVYKGSYAGMFKHVFDLVHPSALINRPVLLTATGGGMRHSLVVEHQLRPLFGFFEACTIPTAIYASETDFTDGVPSNPMVLKRIIDAVDQFAGLAGRPCCVAAE
ncbi:FMN reductase [Aminobacter sp. SS-2016]